jgi:hypothetical protein
LTWQLFGIFFEKFGYFFQSFGLPCACQKGCVLKFRHNKNCTKMFARQNVCAPKCLRAKMLARQNVCAPNPVRGYSLNWWIQADIVNVQEMPD